MDFSISNRRYYIRSECCDCGCWAINSRKANTNSEMSSLSYSNVPLAEKTEGPFVFALTWCIIGKVGFVNWCNSTWDSGVKSLMSDASILSWDGSFRIEPHVSLQGMCGCGCGCIIFSLTRRVFPFVWESAVLIADYVASNAPTPIDPEFWRALQISFTPLALSRKHARSDERHPMATLTHQFQWEKLSQEIHRQNLDGVTV